MDCFRSSNFLRFIFFQAFYPEVKKMLFGDYGNNNDQENCLLKKMKIYVTLGLALASKKFKKRLLEGEWKIIQVVFSLHVFYDDQKKKVMLCDSKYKEIFFGIWQILKSMLFKESLYIIPWNSSWKFCYQFLTI